MGDSNTASGLSHINIANTHPLKSEPADGLKFPDKKRSLRATRPCASAQMPKAKQNDKGRKSAKRSRSPTSVRTIPDNKKIKLEEKKDPFSAKKRAIESLQAKFFTHHRGLFQSLLPASSKIFDKLLSECSPDQKVFPRVELEDQPSEMKSGSMKDYQLQGLSFLLWMHKNGMNCILGDEMGLGKTLQTLSLFAYLKEIEGYSFPNLIICPLSVLPSWINECNRWFPSFKIVKIHGPEKERVHQKDFLRNKDVDIVVTTYDVYVPENSWFKSKHWSYCVLDEGHKIKDWTTQIAHKLQGLGSLHRLILTGTPIQNDLTELWGLLHWLYPTVFVASTQRIFKEAFDLSGGTYKGSFLDSVKKILCLIMLRRTKQLVEHSVPPLEEMVVFLPLTEAQRFWYLRLLRRLDTLTLNDIFQCKIEEDDGRKEVATLVQRQLAEGQQGKRAYDQLMNLLMQLRRLCDHPYMIKGSFPEPYQIGEHIVASSSKLQFIDKLLKDLIPKKERILCFSQWTDMLDMLEDYMALRGISYARLDGSVSRARRALDIRLFQQEESPYQVFLISTKAGGLGINLTKASHVIMCDSEWNPQIDRQAIARSHRIGQTKDVKVYRLICQNSVEDQMLDRLRKKLFLSCKVMAETSNNAGDNSDHMNMRELLNILRRGTSAVSRWEADSSDRGLSAFLSASLEEILARSKQTEKLRDDKLKHEVGETIDNDNLVEELEREEQELLSNVTAVRTRFFEGQWHSKDEGVLNQEWNDIQKRNRTERLVMHNGVASFIDELPYAAGKVGSAPRMDNKKATWEHENTCLDCWDGGDLICCDGCPRVYHTDCRGINAVRKFKGRLLCSQHECITCGKNASAAGGMLFRCRTCPAACCEDCMPEGDIAAVGSTLPELVSLGYDEVSQAYWIYCEYCRVDRHSKQWQQDWEERLAMN